MQGMITMIERAFLPFIGSASESTPKQPSTKIHCYQYVIWLRMSGRQTKVPALRP